jgi:uncharacterized protein (TIGR03437 family)
MRYTFVLSAFLLLSAGAMVPLSAQTLGGCAMFPSNNIWNTPIDTLPVSSHSADYIASIGSSTGLHPDFGSGTYDGEPIGIPYALVTGSQPKVNVSFDYADESDPGPYPIPANAPIEGGADSSGDRHVLLVDTANCILYELYAAYPQSNGTWQAGSGAIFDLKGNQLRTAGWTSADAAGLPILPGLVRYDEIAAGAIRHAIRFTVQHSQQAYLWPARHFASSNTSTSVPPMGARFRLKSSFNVSSFPSEVQIILNAMKKYGIIVADNGSNWFISGVPDDNWNNDNLATLHSVLGSNFEAVDESALMVNADSAQANVSTGTALLSVAMTHSGNFTQGQAGAAYTVTVSDAAKAGATSGAVTVTATTPIGLTAAAMSGTLWNCSGNTCSRSDVLNPGISYPPITMSVSVAEEAPAQVTNRVTVSGGGAAAASASDLTAILAAPGGAYPSILAGGVVNDASYSAPVTAGSIAAAFGSFWLSASQSAAQPPLPSAMEGLSLQFGTVETAPLFYVSGLQVNLQVPWELAGQTQTTLAATLNGRTSSPQTVSLAPFAPAIFSMNSQGTGQGAVLDTSSYLVDSSHPATSGTTYISIYCTGLGAVTNQPATGSAAPTTGPLSWTTIVPVVTIGGAPAGTVSYYGLAPGFAGLYQVNALVPAASAKGASVPVTISMGGTTSNAVTISVQ